MRFTKGFTLIELMVTLAIAALMAVSLGYMINDGLTVWKNGDEDNTLTHSARYAMKRMTKSVKTSSLLLIPQPTGLPLRNILAIALDTDIDADKNGTADADNNADGTSDNDIPADHTNDNAPGIIGIDDDGDGIIDEGNNTDNNEDGINDGLPPPVSGSDWIDPIVYYLNGTDLIERKPVIGALNGSSFVEQVLANNVTTFNVNRVDKPRYTLIEISLTLTQGKRTYSLNTHTRISGS